MSNRHIFPYISHLGMISLINQAIWGRFPLQTPWFQVSCCFFISTSKPIRRPGSIRTSKAATTARNASWAARTGPPLTRKQHQLEIQWENGWKITILLWENHHFEKKMMVWKCSELRPYKNCHFGMEITPFSDANMLMLTSSKVVFL